jgi:ABC-type uncharacterized transport system fused permease/ATPase subunit
MIIFGQSPYMAATRCLSEQLSYPHISSAQIDPDDLKRALQAVHLEHLLLADEHDFESLPLNDKSKLCVARCLMHRSKCVVLVDMELDTMSEIFTALEKAGVAVVTVVRCLTPTQLRYHQKHLQLTGGGEWSLRDCDITTSTDRSLANACMPEADKPLRQQPEQRVAEPPSPTNARDMPRLSTINRLRMMYGILLPSWSPFDRGMFLVIANIVFTCTNIYLTSTMLSALPGQLQATAMQQDRIAYARLVGWATVVRLARCTLWQARERCHHNCGLFFRDRLTAHIHKRYFSSGDFWRMHHLDGRILNADVVITEDVWAMGRYVAVLQKISPPKHTHHHHHHHHHHHQSALLARFPLPPPL